MAVRLTTENSSRSTSPIRLGQGTDSRTTNLHTRVLPKYSRVKRVEAVWCPVCHSGKESITEQLVGGRPKWKCAVCGHVW